MAEVEHAREVLERERRSVVGEIRQLAGKWEREARRHEAVRKDIFGNMKHLLVRGRDAGVPIAQMAHDGGITRQRAHVLIREAETDAIRGEGGDA